MGSNVNMSVFFNIICFPDTPDFGGIISCFVPGNTVLVLLIMWFIYEGLY